jgi:hypothetical protein
MRRGGTVRSEYTAEYDGKQVIVRGSRGMLLPVSLKRPDSHTVIASYTKELHVVATSRRVTTVGVYEKTLRKVGHAKGPQNSTEARSETPLPVKGSQNP